MKTFLRRAGQRLHEATSGVLALSALMSALAAALVLQATPAVADGNERVCEIDRPLVLADLPWASNAFHVALASRILGSGYGCQVRTRKGTTLALFADMAAGRVDITMELWKDNFPKRWRQAAKAGKVLEAGVNFPDASQGWYVPAWLVRGDGALAPDLKSVSDLQRHKDLFSDPEHRDRGRFYNCSQGWACEAVNTRKLHAYGLSDSFTNFRPANGAALAVAIGENYRRKRPFVAYYWSPTWVLGTYDMVALTEPAHDPAIWQAMMESTRPDAATAYPRTRVTIGVHAALAAAAPDLMAFLQNYRTSSALLSQILARQRLYGESAAEAADGFLRRNPDIWMAWVPDAVAAQVQHALE